MVNNLRYYFTVKNDHKYPNEPIECSEKTMNFILVLHE